MSNPKPRPSNPSPVASASGKRKAGRPAYQPDDATRDLVKMMVAFGHSEDEIAAAAGIARMTMRKAYGEELTLGRAKTRGEVLILLLKAARTGNVSAIKHIEAMTSGRKDADQPYELPKGAEAPAVEPEEKAEVLGKKAQRLLDAQTPDLSNPMGALMAERHEPKKHGAVN